MVKNIVRRIYHKLFGKYMLLALLAKEFDNGSRILDVGCGYSSSIRLIRKGSYRVGLDFYKPYILKSKRALIHDDYVLGDVRALPFKPNSFDCGVAIEVLEHLNKHDGPRMVREMERVAKRITLTTPNGFLPTYPGPNDNPDERHLCGWTVDELKKLGFKVYGLNGLKLLWEIRSGRATLRRPNIVFALLAGISELFVYRHPSLAFQLFGVKELKK